MGASARHARFVGGVYVLQRLGFATGSAPCRLLLFLLPQSLFLFFPADEEGLAALVDTAVWFFACRSASPLFEGDTRALMSLQWLRRQVADGSEPVSGTADTHFISYAIEPSRGTILPPPVNYQGIVVSFYTKQTVFLSRVSMCMSLTSSSFYWRDCRTFSEGL